MAIKNNYGDVKAFYFMCETVVLVMVINMHFVNCSVSGSMKLWRNLENLMS